MQRLRYTITSKADHARTWNLKIGGGVSLSAGETSKPLWLNAEDVELLENSGLQVDCVEPEAIAAAMEAEPELVADVSEGLGLAKDEYKSKVVEGARQAAAAAKKERGKK